MFANLLNDFSTLGALLTQRLEAPRLEDEDEDERLTPFLLAAGLHQILEDYLHRASPVLARTRARFSTFDHPLARPVARLAGAGVAIDSRLRTSLARSRGLFTLRDDLTTLLQVLADAACSGEDDVPAEALALWARVQGPIEAAPAALRGAVVRLPNPFANFDLLPEDCGELARRFAAGWPDRERPIVLVGIRTSGTYLVPLYRSLLRAEGYRSVELVTVRPGQEWDGAQAALVRGSAARGGLVVVVDDPPARGCAVRRVAEACRRQGVDAGSIVLLLPLLTPADALPEALATNASVVLPWREWAIHERLEPAAVAVELRRLLSGREIHAASGEPLLVEGVRDVRRVDTTGDSGPRSHVGGTYRAAVVDRAGAEAEVDVRVRGIGVGYFAGHSRSVAAALAGSVPEVYGYSPGLVYAAGAAAEQRLELRDARTPKAVAEYVRARRLQLPVAPALARRVVDQYASWDLVADLIGLALLGRLRILAFPLTHAAGRRLVELERANVVDGEMALANWSVDSVGRAVKTDYDRGAFANAARVTYDATFDLAAAASSFDTEELLAGDGPGEAAFSERLLEAADADQVDPERWLVYQLLATRFELGRVRGQLRRDRAAGLVHRLLALERALGAAQRRYVAALYLGDFEPATTGELCALDVDWVLETRWLDAPALTPAGARALRSLLHHGLRPVIATGRSLEEVRSRCRAYRLAGGVAEYGCVVYDHSAGRAVPQVRPEDDAALGRLRTALEDTPGVFLDPAYKHAVRALRISDNGRRRALRDEDAAEAVASVGVENAIRMVHGHLQTDFVPASHDKGTGLRALARELGCDGEAEWPLAFAIGDDAPDVPMLRLARRRFAPANATPALRSEALRLQVAVVRGRHAAGVLQAVDRFLGHRPSRCAVCPEPRLAPRTKLVTIPLSAADGPRRSRVLRVAELAAVLLGEDLRARRGDTLSAFRG